MNAPAPTGPPFDSSSTSDTCRSCGLLRSSNLKKLGLDMDRWDFVIALAGNPNTGKSTVFNALTGLRQHTGNWPGKTVARAEGSFEYQDWRFKLVDLPGTYSLLSTSLDEQIARDFILFGQPSVTVVVVDATQLERNLNLLLQVLEMTDRVVVCLNLIDEAHRNGLAVDDRQLARDLGVPVVAASARFGQGLIELLQTICDVACGKIVCQPRRFETDPPAIQPALKELISQLQAAFPILPRPRWIALRLLGGDDRIVETLRDGEIAALNPALIQPAFLGPGGKLIRATLSPPSPAMEAIFTTAQRWREEIPGDLHEHIVEAIYRQAAWIANRAVSRPGQDQSPTWDRAIDCVVTSRVWGFPIMILLFAVILWITINGANVPSGWIAGLLVDLGHPWLKELFNSAGSPWWLTGVAVDGMYLATAWVVSVMLPPMAIFFPLFTLLEDSGYLPRVAFNIDRLFKACGAHGKQAMTMIMGFGCNAAGVVSTRIIDSPRERLLAILTNNFSLCNGRWPTQFLIATVFIGSLVPVQLAGLVSTAAVTAVAVFGVCMTFLVGWLLWRTVLKGEVSSFSLELPPYRPPSVWRTIYTSLLDRTFFVLWRAIVFALPAGAGIWLCANVHIGGDSLAGYFIGWSNPLGHWFGLNGVILLAYLIAIPANEIVIPTILMLTVLATGAHGVGQGAGVMFKLDSMDALRQLLAADGWTALTAVNLMLFSLLHNPCSTTLYTIYKETGSIKWTSLAALLPLGLGLAATSLVAAIWRWLSP